MKSTIISCPKHHSPGLCSRPWTTTTRMRSATLFTRALLPRSEHDVIIVGAGIIGLSIARHVLLHSDLSVAVTDAAVPCSGATGAGQGYIWLAHKSPRSEIWELAKRSKQLWEELVVTVEHDGLDPQETIGWKRTGSLLVGRTSKETTVLVEKVKDFNREDVRAEYLSVSALHLDEPAVEVGKSGGAAFLPDDAQLDALQTVDYIRKVNISFSSDGRYAEYFNEPVTSLMRSDRSTMIEGVKTSSNILSCRKVVVIAAGAWAGSLMQSLSKPDVSFNLPVQPRKGHLLILENFEDLKLNHGLMEVGYVDHQALPWSSENFSSDEDKNLPSSVSMTATIDAKGFLLLGSSRQFCGFSREVNQSIVHRIVHRAAEFFPALRSFSSDVLGNRNIRIGHRPYMPDGKPVIGFAPGLSNVLLAVGHEGNGLSLALGTAELVTDMIVGNSERLDRTPFSVVGRF